MNLDHLKKWINKFQTTRQHTHTQQQGLQAFLLDLEASKHLVQQFSWLWCKWSSGDCLVDILKVSEKTGCSSCLEWTSINNCVQFLYPYLFNSVLLFWNWYKQLIVSLKQSIVFPALCFCCLLWKNWILNQGSFKVFSF